MSRYYGVRPDALGAVHVECKEFLVYQYMPIKLAGEGRETVTLEKRLEFASPVVWASLNNYRCMFGEEEFKQRYVYLTAKHLWQQPGASFNRPGYHTDGFGTDDVTYVWSNHTPTIFNVGVFDLPHDDDDALVEMERQARSQNEIDYGNNMLIRLDQYCVHRACMALSPAPRTFLKLSISRDRYDLEGNSRNYDLDYDWPTRPRSESRNVPQEITSSPPCAREPSRA